MYELVKYPSETLTRKSILVEEFDESLSCLVDGMFKTVRLHNGIGLAAPQIGKNVQVIVVDITDGEQRIQEAFINPRILSTSKTRNSQVEGCLSVPDIYGSVFRWNWIKMEYWDTNGNRHQLRADDIFSRVLQHEIDHINGVLFLSHLSPKAQRLYVK